LKVIWAAAAELMKLAKNEIDFNSDILDYILYLWNNKDTVRKGGRSGLKFQF
jgi:hypothetical protein